MKNIFSRWGRRYFSNEEAVVLLVIILGIAFCIIGIGHLLLPIIFGIVVAYLLHGMVHFISPWYGKKLAFWVVYLGFLSLFLSILFIVIPIMIQQLNLFFEELPHMADTLILPLNHLPLKYRAYLAQDHVQAIIQQAFDHLPVLGKAALAASIDSLPQVFSFVIGLILFPLIVFFLLHNPQIIFQWFGQFLPTNRAVLTHIWQQIDGQLSNYVRGKFVEGVLVGGLTYIGFWIFGLKYSMLLAFFVGLSVFIPYIGCVLVSVPVVIVSLFQWGLHETFIWSTLVYGLIQALDACLLGPVIFSETMNLHPIVIIAAILFFGGIWGVSGMFFAIPLAAVAKILLESWPQTSASLYPAH